MYPEDLRYTPEHEWVRTTGETVVVGITQYAQDALGDIVYVDLPAVGTVLSAGGPCGEVESTKSVSEIYAPIAGEVVATNAQLDGAPETVNSDPYGDGWLVEIKPADPAQVDALLDAAAYTALVGGS